MYQVMIVDDEQMIINSLALGFDWRAHGYEIVATTTNSREALEMIRFIRPDVVFTDVKMPGITGLELMRLVRAELPQVRFVLISGYADFSYAQTAISLGASGYCLKPLEDEELEATLANVTSHLNAQQEALQETFHRFLRTPEEQTARALLEKLYIGSEVPEHLSVAISVGRAHPLLSSNVSYASVGMADNAFLYFISSNDEYLSSVSFCTALLNAAREKRLVSFAWCTTQEPVTFLHTMLPTLLDSAYSYFMLCPATLGLVQPAENTTGDACLAQASALANKNRTMELLELLEQVRGGTPTLRPCEALVLYGLCAALICRMDAAAPLPTVSSVCQLAQIYEDIGEMLGMLIRRLETLSGSVDPENLRNDTFRKVLNHINRSFTSPLSFHEICTEYCINPSYLSQLFKKEIGVTFTSYVTNLRLQYAKELLETTPLRISEIAEKIGYSFDYNFTKLFKKETGFTPREYREHNQRDS